MNIAMREDYLKIVQSVFDNYAEFSLIDTTMDGDMIRANFTYCERPLMLYIFEPDNTYLREVFICIEDGIADKFHLPPHYMRYNDKKKLSYLCLLDKEQHILSSYSLFDLIKLYLEQVQSLLTLSPRQMATEYLKEFEFYWNSACQLLGSIHVEAEVYLPTSETASLLNCWYSEEKRSGKYIILPKGAVLNSWNTPKGSVSTAIYIPIEVPEGIIPPQANAPWDAKDILNIVYSQTIDRISPASFEFLRHLQVDNYKKVVIFSFSQPNSVPISVVGILSFNNKGKKSFIDKIQEDFISFVPIHSSRMDLKYLHERVGQAHTNPPSVLLLGCGSVGSYILPELINLGIVNIGISDPDEFTSGNAFRHYLGPRSDGQNKTFKMKLFMEFENPLVLIDEISNLLEMDDSLLSKTLEKYQVVIVAVGGTDRQRRFNYRFAQIKSTAWFLYNWLDAEGKGSHALAMRYSQKGCFNCLFYSSGELFGQSKVSYADGSEKVIGNGCGGSFSPYGNNVLVRNTSLAISMLRGILDGTISKNTVASIKNDFSLLESSITAIPIINDSFAEERCEICGHL